MQNLYRYQTTNYWSYIYRYLDMYKQLLYTLSLLSPFLLNSAEDMAAYFPFVAYLLFRTDI